MEQKNSKTKMEILNLLFVISMANSIQTLIEISFSSNLMYFILFAHIRESFLYLPGVLFSCSYLRNYFV